MLLCDQRLTNSRNVSNSIQAMGQLCLIINCSEGLDCKVNG